jgi:uncharacterized protein YbbC (DUF1343 family)
MKSTIYLLIITICLLFSSCFFTSCATVGTKKVKAKVQTGLDILEKEDFARLEGKKIGLISNHSALNSKGESILDIMLKSKNCKIQAIFAPEHGFKGVAEEHVKDSRDKKSGLTIYSLYGKSLRPKKEQLKDIDILVFDIQDIGARFYTYIGTMAMCMEEAAKNEIEFMVLDRPNPIGGLRVGGPIQDRNLYKKITSYFPIPVIHGMTAGELAKMFNSYFGIQCDLSVIEMTGWKRIMFFDETGLPWVNPSPNIRNVTQELLYPGIALTESWNSNVSVGRGTDTPFEVVGAPWIDADKLVAEMNSREIPGIALYPHHYIPSESKFKGKNCHGLRIEITDRSEFNSMVTGLNLLSSLYKLYPETYRLEQNHGLVGSRDVLERIKKDQPVELIRASYGKTLQNFNKIRNKFLIYKN